MISLFMYAASVLRSILVSESEEGELSPECHSVWGGGGLAQQEIFFQGQNLMENLPPFPFHFLGEWDSISEEVQNGTRNLIQQFHFPGNGLQR